MIPRNPFAVCLASVTLLGGLVVGSARAQEVVGHSIAQSGKNLTMTLDLSDGRTVTIRLSDGTVFVNDSAIGTYTVDPRAAVEGAALAQHAAEQTTAQLLSALQALQGDSAASMDTAPLEAALARATGVAIARALAKSGVRQPAVAPRPVFPTPPQGARVTSGAPMAFTVEGPSLTGGIAAGLTNLAAVFVSLALMGLGLLVFAPRQLEIVADTVWHSFGRSFLAGLFAQPLLLPVFGMMIVGLTLTVVGILVIPVAVIAFALAVVIAAVGGFLGVARTIGEIYLRRRMARGETLATWGSYRYIVYGLVGVLALWLPAIVLGWIPMAGHILFLAALVMTWVLATAGFGAAILSRGGIRGSFVRKLDLALTDEHYWTADGLPTPPARRRGNRYP